MFVERLWHCALDGSAALPELERVAPGGGSMDLIFNLAADELQTFESTDLTTPRRHSAALAVGAQTRSYLADPRQRVSVIGAHFRPGAAFRFLGVSAAEVVDSHVALHDIWGSSARSLRDRLLECPSPRQRLTILESALRERWQRSKPSHPAVPVAVATLGAGGARIADVASQVGLSHRRFVEVFEREVGLTPKLFGRLQRFHRVKQRLATLRQAPGWAAFALEQGYFDQSHLIRDFVEFSGHTPASYLRAAETRLDQLIHAYPKPLAR